MMRNKHIEAAIIVCTLCLVLSSPIPARTIHVDDDAPADFATIQSAIDDANDGDTVIIHPGLYTGLGNRDIEFNNKGIDIRSELGPMSCVIDCDGSINDPHRGFHLHATRPNPYMPLPVQSLDGFTIIDGFADLGGGVYCSAGTPIIRNCIFMHNQAGAGGGSHCKTASATFVNCIFSSNEAAERGAGVYFGAGSRFVNCTFHENEVACVGHAYGVGPLENCIVWSPLYTELLGHPGAGGGVMTMRIVNCCIRPDLNDPWWSSRWNADSPCQPYPLDLYPIDPRSNILTADSPFVDASAEDFRLSPDSPCIDGGNPVPDLPETDMGGNPRIVDGDCDGVAKPDIGAYEAEPLSAAYLLVSTDNLEFSTIEDGPSPSPQMFEIRNVGRSVLNWSVALSDEWIQVYPPSGRLTAGADQITVSIRGGELDVGTHSGSLVISDPCAASESREVAVTFTIAQTVHVPSEIPTIEEAIDSALPGAVIVVADGVYELPDTIDFQGKPVTLRSQDGPNSCVLSVSPGSDLEMAVVFVSGEDARSILEGFTISGPARRSSSKGVYCASSGPTIRNCHIVDFEDGIFGHRACPVIASCRLTGNSSGLRLSGSPTIVGSVISDNFEGTSLSVGSPSVEDCILSQNHVGIRCLYTADAQIKMCIIQNNQTAGDVETGSQTTISECTVVGNRSGLKRTYNRFGNSTSCVVNSIMRDNLGSPLDGYWHVAYSNVDGGWQGIGNINADPLFAEHGRWDRNGTPNDLNDDFWVAGDYHLKSQVGRWEPDSGTWVVDEVTSPCIDAGDPNSPVADEPEPNGGRVNMGAYGGTVEASKSCLPE